ncbi:hypothetical protein TRVL_00942 [Trypanosoma vivax]|nr:hypothetical protein TRVL_00942 [Trypanosoma vivax]
MIEFNFDTTTTTKKNRLERCKWPHRYITRGTGKVTPRQILAVKYEEESSRYRDTKRLVSTAIEGWCFGNKSHVTLSTCFAVETERDIMSGEVQKTTTTITMVF